MRFESPVHLGHRWIAEDIEVEGRRFQGGTKVMVVWASANLDPDAVGDPLTVDLERADVRHVGFASGFHRCLGSHLARLELRIALEELHRRIPDYRITPGAAPVYLNYGVRAAIQLPLSFTAECAMTYVKRTLEVDVTAAMPESARRSEPDHDRPRRRRRSGEGRRRNQWWSWPFPVAPTIAATGISSHLAGVATARQSGWPTAAWCSWRATTSGVVTAAGPPTAIS